MGGSIGNRSGYRCGAAGEELIPGAESRPRTVNLDRQRLFQGDVPVTLLGPLDGIEELGAEDHVVLDRIGARFVLERRQRVRDQRAVGRRARALDRRAQEHDPLGELATDIGLPAAELSLELVAPGAEDVGPGVDRVLPATLGIDHEVSAPAHSAQVGIDLGEL